MSQPFLFSPHIHNLQWRRGGWGAAGGRVPWDDIQVCWMPGQIWLSTAWTCSQVLGSPLQLLTHSILSVPWVLVRYKYDCHNLNIPVDKAISISDIEPLDCAKNFGGWKEKVKVITLKHNKVQECYLKIHFYTCIWIHNQTYSAPLTLKVYLHLPLYFILNTVAGSSAFTCYSSAKKVYHTASENRAGLHSRTGHPCLLFFISYPRNGQWSWKYHCHSSVLFSLVARHET